MYLLLSKVIVKTNRLVSGKNIFQKSIILNKLQRSSMSTVNTSNKHKIAICQITCKSDINENFNICKELITEAKKQGAEMAFLPEACDYIESSTKASIEKAQTLDGEFIRNFRKLASDLDIWISIGSFHRKPEIGVENRIFNSHVILDNTGQIKCINDKLHLFEMNVKNGDVITSLKESDYTTPGTEFYMPVQSPIGNIGTAICYDVRFTQLSTLLTKMGAHILTYPSVFTVHTGQAHWEVLLRARAIENQCYVIAAAQVGKHNEKRSSYGYSMVVDPWGKIIANCEQESPSFRIAEIDLDYLNEIRTNIPMHKSMRPDLYLSIPIVKKKIEQEFYDFGTRIKLHNSVVFLETQYSIAFVNIKPIVPGHVVLIPKKLSLRVEDMDDEEAIDLFHTARYVAKKLEKHYNATSLNFGIQDGPESGQSVKHVHMHILPRKKGDFEKDDEIYDRLRTHDKEMTNLRTPEEMAQEASELRKLFSS